MKEATLRKNTHHSMKSMLCFAVLLMIACAPQEEHPDVEELTFSLSSGVYEEEKLELTITAPQGYTVAYTTDGTVPTIEDDSRKQSISIVLKPGTEGYLIKHADLQLMPEYKDMHLLEDPSLPAGRMVTAALVNHAGELEDMRSEVYFLSPSFSELFPGALVFSVMIDPYSLLDYDTGILATGAVYDAWKQTEQGKAALEAGKYWDYETNSTQHGRAWERLCSVQIYDGDNAPAVESVAGIRVQGDVSRRYSQKSFFISETLYSRYVL